MKPTRSQTAGSGASPFRPGQPIAEDGIYRVIHADHRVSHEVTLLCGHQFPECAQCGREVHFELVRAVPRLETDAGFRINLYSIPHPEEQAEEDEQKTG